jgi:hypothetical protein
MSQDTRTIRIFVGSPGDVAEERKQTFEIIERLNRDPLLPDGWRVEPIGWDRSPCANTTWLSPQKVIDEGLPRPSECDIALFVLWSRIGTPLSDADYPPETRPVGLERAPTGTEWEFFDAMGAGEKTGLPSVLTFRCQRERTAKGGSDYQALFFQWQSVDAFFERFQDDAGSFRWSCTDFGDTEEFADKLNAGLRDAIKKLIETTSGKKRKRTSRSEPNGPRVSPDYLRWLREEDTRIPLLGLDPKKPNTARLPQVYVPALTQSRKKALQTDKDERTYDLLLDRLNTESIYIPGAPGAGKSVFCRWVAWVVAAGRMGEHAGEEPAEYRERLPKDLLTCWESSRCWCACGSSTGMWTAAGMRETGPGRSWKRPWPPGWTRDGRVVWRPTASGATWRRATACCSWTAWTRCR